MLAASTFYPPIEQYNIAVMDLHSDAITPRVRSLLPSINGHPYYADYNASKAGVILLARTMALELAPKVRVNAVCQAMY